MHRDVAQVRRSMAQHSLLDRREIVRAVRDGRAVRNPVLARTAILYASHVVGLQGSRSNRRVLFRVGYRSFHPLGYTLWLEGPPGRAEDALRANELLVSES